jgi:hypothetical protein
MPRISGRSFVDPHSLLLTAALLFACGTRDARVGSVPRTGGMDGGADLGPPLLSSELASNDGLWQVWSRIPGAAVAFGSSSPLARDGRALLMSLPGAAVGDPATNAGTALATEIDSVQFLRYGTLRSRVQFPTCVANEEVAAAMFWFYNDGQDRDGNGIVDNPEIDLHVLCGTPSFLVLTVWSDYQEEKNGGETFLRATRAIDLASGDIYDGVSDHERAYVKTGSDPGLAHPGFAPGAGFQEIGIDWRADAVRFFVVLDGIEVTLWTLTDSRLIPQVPLGFCFNLWHPTTHWLPPAAPALYPAADAVMRIDWFGYWPAQ